MAEPRGGLDERIEDGLEIEGRAADHLQHVAGRGLAFEQLLQIARQLAQLGQEPRVLDRDDRLVGEGADQLDLALAERLDPAAAKRDHADRLAFAQQRYAERRADVANRNRLGHRVVRVCGDIGNVEHLTFERGSTSHRSAIDGEYPVPQGGLVLGRKGDARHRPVDLAVAGGKMSVFGATEPRRGIDERVENRLQIECRAADDFQHVAGRGLAFEQFLQIARAFAQFGQEPRVLDRDDRVVGEGVHQLDLPLAERLDPVASEKQHTDRLAIAQERDSKRGTDLADPDHARQSVIGVGGDIGNMDQFAVERCPPGNCGAAGRKHQVTRERVGIGRVGDPGHRPVDLAFAAVDARHVGSAESSRRLDERVEHRLQIEGGAADHFQHGTVAVRYSRNSSSSAPHAASRRSRSATSRHGSAVGSLPTKSASPRAWTRAARGPDCCRSAASLPRSSRRDRPRAVKPAGAAAHSQSGRAA